MKRKYDKENNPNFKHGKTLKKYYCMDCGKEISTTGAIYKNVKRCSKCAYKYRKSQNQNFCNICKKKLGKRSKLCRECWLNNIPKGKDSPFFIKGLPKCQDCGKQLANYDTKRCQSCCQKGKLNHKFGKIEDSKSKESRMKKIFKVLNLKSNKPEKILNRLLKKILPKEYKYVGDGKVILGGFNPDFININGQKKIIELYGDYWHNLPEYKKRDKRRLIAYKKYGYKTLIIWEHELKEPEKVISKTMEFDLNK